MLIFVNAIVAQTFGRKTMNNTAPKKDYVSLSQIMINIGDVMALCHDLRYSCSVDTVDGDECLSKMSIGHAHSVYGANEEPYNKALDSAVAGLLEYDESDPDHFAGDTLEEITIRIDPTLFLRLRILDHSYAWRY